jgi:hypothetical protein
MAKVDSESTDTNDVDMYSLPISVSRFLYQSQSDSNSIAEIRNNRKLKVDELLLGINLKEDDIMSSEFCSTRASISRFIFQNHNVTPKEEWLLCSQFFEAKTILEKNSRRLEIHRHATELGFNFEGFDISPCVHNYIETGKIDEAHVDLCYCDMNRKLLSKFHLEDLKLSFQMPQPVNDSLISKLVVHNIYEVKGNLLVEQMINYILIESKYNAQTFKMLLSKVKTRIKIQPNESITTPKLKAIIEVCYLEYLNYVKSAAVLNEKFEKNALDLLKTTLLERWYWFLTSPLISKYILPLENLIKDPEYLAIVDKFVNPIHRSCSKHFTLCLEWTISELCCIFRKRECILYLNNQIRLFMKNFKGVESLKSVSAKERYASAIKLGLTTTNQGMWLHIPLNAFRIYRDEVLNFHLVNRLGRFNINDCSQIVRDHYHRFIVTNTPLPNGIIPETNEIMLLVESIKEMEIIRVKRQDEVKDLLLYENMDFDFLYVNDGSEFSLKMKDWIKSELNIEVAIVIIKDHQKQNLINKKKALIDQMIQQSPRFISLFKTKFDQGVFVKSREFEIIKMASLLYQMFLKDYNDVFVVVEDICVLVKDVIENRICPYGILVLLNLFD